MDDNLKRFLVLYMRLDEGDQGEIRGMMKEMLKADKYLFSQCEIVQIPVKKCLG